jgi:hypothetical protein
MAKNKQHPSRNTGTKTKTKTCTLCTSYARVPVKEYAAHMRQHEANARTGKRSAKVGR